MICMAQTISKAVIKKSWCSMFYLCSQKLGRMCVISVLCIKSNGLLKSWGNEWPRENWKQGSSSWSEQARRWCWCWWHFPSDAWGGGQQTLLEHRFSASLASALTATPVSYLSHWLSSEEGWNSGTWCFILWTLDSLEYSGTQCLDWFREAKIHPIPQKKKKKIGKRKDTFRRYL